MVRKKKVSSSEENDDKKSASEDMGVPVRMAVPENEIDRFMMMVWCLVKTFKIDEQSELCHYVELLGQACERHVFEQKCGKSLSAIGTNEERKRFIIIFKARYLQSFDIDYKRRITPVEMKIIGNLVKDLQDMNITSDEFLRWVFEDFLEENPKFCPPTLKLLASAFIIDRFNFEFKDLIKEKHQIQLKVKEGLDLINRVRSVMRNGISSEQIELAKDILTKYREERIMVTELREIVTMMEAGEWEKLKKRKGKND